MNSSKEGKSTEPVHTVLFCTDVAARGLDFPNLAGSVQYDAPATFTITFTEPAVPEDSPLQRWRQPVWNFQRQSQLFSWCWSEEAYVQETYRNGEWNLRKESFDEYLKWVEKLDAKSFKVSLLSRNNKAANSTITRRTKIHPKIRMKNRQLLLLCRQL